MRQLTHSLHTLERRLHAARHGRAASQLRRFRYTVACTTIFVAFYLCSLYFSSTGDARVRYFSTIVMHSAEAHAQAIDQSIERIIYATEEEAHDDEPPAPVQSQHGMPARVWKAHATATAPPVLTNVVAPTAARNGTRSNSGLTKDVARLGGLEGSYKHRLEQRRLANGGNTVTKPQAAPEPDIAQLPEVVVGTDIAELPAVVAAS